MKRFLFILLANFLLVGSRVFSDSEDQDEVPNLGEENENLLFPSRQVGFYLYNKQIHFENFSHNIALIQNWKKTFISQKSFRTKNRY